MGKHRDRTYVDRGRKARASQSNALGRKGSRASSQRGTVVEPGLKVAMAFSVIQDSSV